MKENNIEKAIEALELEKSDITAKQIAILYYLTELNDAAERINSECEFIWDTIASIAAVIDNEKR